MVSKPVRHSLHKILESSLHPPNLDWRQFSNKNSEMGSETQLWPQIHVCACK